MGFRKSQVSPEIWAAAHSAKGVKPPAGSPLATAKPSKFRNKKTVVDGQTFDSKKEAARFAELQLLEDAGQITDLRTQVEFPIVVNGVTVCKYVADFVYVEDVVTTVEDVKSVFTRKNPVYRLKAKLMAALGIVIKEV